MSTSHALPSYALGRSDAETERLRLQHEVYRPITAALLTAAGLGRGMRVLDLGSGCGDVSMMVAEMVGPEGRVVGIDVVRGAARCARPGGVVVMQDTDLQLTLHANEDSAGPVLASLLRALVPRSGADPFVGRRLYSIFLDAGLSAPQVRLEAPIGGAPGWPGPALMAARARSLLPFLEQTGTVAPGAIDVETLEGQLRSELAERNATHVLPVVIGGWART